MKKIITTVILMIIACINIYGQDTAKLKRKKLPPYVKNFGPYTVTINDDGKPIITKNADFDASKAVRRDTSSIHHRSTHEVYTANATVPIMKEYLIYDRNSVISSRSMSRQETMAKYHSRAGVNVIYFKPGVMLLDKVELLDHFNVASKNYNLPLYFDYKPVANPDDLLAVPDAVSKIKAITDGDGFKFLNISTKAFDAEVLKHAGQPTIVLR